MNRIVNLLNGVRPEFDFESVTNFIEEGMLDSFDVITIVTCLEDTFDIRITGTDIVSENFSSIDAIEQLVLKNGGNI